MGVRGPRHQDGDWRCKETLESLGLGGSHVLETRPCSSPVERPWPVMPDVPLRISGTNPHAASCLARDGLSCPPWPCHCCIPGLHSCMATALALCGLGLAPPHACGPQLLSFLPAKACISQGSGFYPSPAHLGLECETEKTADVPGEGRNSGLSDLLPLSAVRKSPWAEEPGHLRGLLAEPRT